MNTSTPRIFIAATEQNTGKTTTSLGLYASLRERFHRIGFIKPVGQRFTEVDGKRIDEDSVLIRDTFGTEVPIEDMSPIAVEPDFTRRYINQSNHETLARRIQHSFDRACWEKDFAIIEGTGHAGVGSTFDLSNATVARLLASKVILVTPGGIGRPIDEAALNKALFDREGVEVIGVVMNKVHPEKMDSITDFASRGFERIGLELLGVIPMEDMLAQPTLRQICEHIRGQFLYNESLSRRPSKQVMIGAVSSANLFIGIEEGTLLVVPGDREDVVLAALSRSMSAQKGSLAGMVLSDDLRPHGRLLEMLGQTTLPVILSPMDCYTIAQRIHSMTVKTLPGDTRKIDCIQDLISRHVAIPRLLEKIGCPA
ncbi:MAG: phosphotransacetylase family protein [Terrimicrobiaceae bacterium]